MRVPTIRTLALGATATLLLGGLTTSAWGGDRGPSVARPVNKVIWCRQSNDVMRQVWAKTPCKAGESKRVLKAGTGPTGPQGPTGATGPSGPAGPTGKRGARGPSDLFPGTLAPQLQVSDAFATFDTVSVPAGSYLVQFSTDVSGSTAAQRITCTVVPPTGPDVRLPSMASDLPASASAMQPLSATGWYTAAADTTLALKCQVSATGQTATLSNLRMSALKVVTIH